MIVTGSRHWIWQLDGNAFNRQIRDVVHHGSSVITRENTNKISIVLNIKNETDVSISFMGTTLAFRIFPFFS